MTAHTHIQIDDSVTCERCKKLTRHFRPTDGSGASDTPWSCLACVRKVLDGEVALPKPDIGHDAMLVLKTAAVMSRGATAKEIILASGLNPERGRAAIEKLIQHELMERAP